MIFTPLQSFTFKGGILTFKNFLSSNGKVPFNIDLREGGDAGAPVVVSAPDSPSAKAIEAIVSQLIVREKSLLGVRLGLA